MKYTNFHGLPPSSSLQKYRASSRISHFDCDLTGETILPLWQKHQAGGLIGSSSPGTSAKESAPLFQLFGNPVIR